MLCQEAPPEAALMNPAPCPDTNTASPGLRASLCSKALMRDTQTLFWLSGPRFSLFPHPRVGLQKVQGAHVGLAHGQRTGGSRNPGHKGRNVRNKTALEAISSQQHDEKSNIKSTKKRKFAGSSPPPWLFWQGSCCSIPHSVLWDGSQTIGGPHSSRASTGASRE